MAQHLKKADYTRKASPEKEKLVNFSKFTRDNSTAADAFLSPTPQEGFKF